MSEKLTKTSSDQFIARLKNGLDSLQKCQESKALDSCLKCQQVLGCEIRRAYVKAVYESMNKGENGGFEF